MNDITEPQLSEPAWFPGELGKKLQIGARVRVRMHPECPRTGVDHGFKVDGMEGEIAFFRKDPTTHPYAVVLDDSKPHWNYFAAIELEPLRQSSMKV